MILDIFDLKVTLMLSTKSQVNWPVGSGREVKKHIFKMAAIAAILDFRIPIFSYFLIYKKPPVLPTKFQVNWPFGPGGEVI